MLAASYRPVMQQVQKAKMIGVPFFLISASITPGMELHLADHTFITSPAIIREPTYRPELGFRVSPQMFSARTEAAEALGGPPMVDRWSASWRRRQGRGELPDDERR